MSASLEYAGDIDNDIVVVASDTDILVLLMFHWKEGMNIYMLAETPTKKMWIASFGRLRTWSKKQERLSRVTFCSFMLGQVVILHLQYMGKVSR